VERQIQFTYSSLTEAITNGPVCTCERGALGRGGCGFASGIFCLNSCFRVIIPSFVRSADWVLYLDYDNFDLNLVPNSIVTLKP
jgi:hypothetical protein